MSQRDHYNSSRGGNYGGRRDDYENNGRGNHNNNTHNNNYDKNNNNNNHWGGQQQQQHRRNDDQHESQRNNQGYNGQHESQRNNQGYYQQPQQQDYRRDNRNQYDGQQGGYSEQHSGGRQKRRYDDNNNQQQQQDDRSSRRRNNENEQQNVHNNDDGEVNINTHGKQYKKWWIDVEGGSKDEYKKMKRAWKHQTNEDLAEDYEAWFDVFKEYWEALHNEEEEEEDDVIRVGSRVCHNNNGRMGEVTKILGGGKLLKITWDDGGQHGDKATQRAKDFHKVGSQRTANITSQQSPPQNDRSSRKAPAVEAVGPEVGDAVNCAFEGEMYPGKIDRADNTGYYVVFDGYEDDGAAGPYEARELEITGKAEVHHPASELNEYDAEDEEPTTQDQAEEYEEEVEEVEEETFVPELQSRDRVIYNGEMAFVKKKEYQEDGSIRYGISIQATRDWVSNVSRDELTYMPTKQEQAKAVFAFMGEKRIQQRDFKNCLKSWKDWRPLRFEYFMVDRDGNDCMPECKVDSDDEAELIYWRDKLENGEDNPMPTMNDVKWYCPERTPVPMGCLVKVLGEVTEDGRPYVGRVRNYDWETKLVKVSFKDRESGTTEEIEYTADQLEVQMTLTEKIVHVFAAYGRKKMKKRLFEGYWRTLFGNRPVDGDKIEEFDLGECDESNYVLLVELPEQPEDLPEFPPYFERDVVEIDGNRIPNNPIPHRTVRGFIRGIEGTVARCEYVQPVANRDDRDNDDKHEIEIDFSDLQLSYQRKEKVEIIFAGYQKYVIKENDFKLAMRLLFKDNVNQLNRFLEEADAELDSKTKSVRWDTDEDLPDYDPTLIVPRSYKDGARIEARMGDRWIHGNIVSCTDEYNGMYEIVHKSRDGGEQTREISCLQLRPSVSLWDKIRACFAQAQESPLSVDDVNGYLWDLYGDEIRDFSKIAEMLAERAGIMYDEDEMVLTIGEDDMPPDNLMLIWSKYSDTPLKQKVQTVFKRAKTHEMTFDQFNAYMKKAFDREVEDFDMLNDPLFDVNENSQTITCKVQDLERLTGVDDAEAGNDAAQWELIFETIKIDWESKERRQMAQFGRQQYIHTAEELEKIEQYLTDNKTSFDGDKPWPKPGDTFEQCFSIYKDTPQLAEYVPEVVQKLNSVYDVPTMVQRCCWPALAIDGRDVLGIAKTGSGKTITFLMPIILHCLLQRKLYGEPEPNTCTALVMVPTRELAPQHLDVFNQFKIREELKGLSCIGGVKRYDQTGPLQEGGIDVVFATTGRLFDFMSSGDLDLRDTSYVVIDEADDMLQAANEVRTVLANQVRPCLERKSVLFSATYSEEVLKLEHAFFRNSPLRVTVGQNAVKADEKVAQYFAVVDRYEQRKALYCTLNYIFAEDPGTKIIVFVNSRRDAIELTELVREQGFKVNSMHGDLSHEDRTSAMSDFKSKRCTVIIATDLISRGIDIGRITVVQMGFPISHESVSMAKETYIHRIGRSARANAEGKSYVIEEEGKEVQFDLPEVLNDVGQFGPPFVYNGSPPEEAPEIPDFPIWAGGMNAFNQAVDNNEFATQPFNGSGNGLIHAIQYFAPEFNGNAPQDLTHEKVVAFGKDVVGKTIDVWDVELNQLAGEGGAEISLLWCPADHPSGVIEQDHYRAFFAKPNETEENNTSYVQQANAPSTQNFAGQECNIYYEEDGQTYPGYCETDDGENATVYFEGDETAYTVASNCLSVKGDKVLATVDNSESKNGMKVLVTVDGEQYPAVVEDDFGNGSYMVKYDDESFGSEMKEEADLEFVQASTETAASAESWANCRVEALYSDGAMYAATVGEQANGDGTWPVYFDEEPETAYDVAEGDMTYVSGPEQEVSAETAESWANCRVTALYEQDGNYYAGTVGEAMNADGTWPVYFDEEPEIMCSVSTEHLTLEEAAGGNVSVFAEGARVNAVYDADGETYPATLSVQQEDGSWSVYYDAEAKTEYFVTEDKLELLTEEAVQEEAQVPASVFSEGARVSALYEQDGSMYPATLGPQNEDGSWQVYYDAEAETPYDLTENKLELLVEESPQPESETTTVEITEYTEETQSTVTDTVPESVFFENARVNAVYAEDGQTYAATLGPQNEDGTWVVYYDAEPENPFDVVEDNLELLGAEQTTEESNEAPVSPFYAECRVSAMFEGAEYPATLGAQNVEDGTWEVYFDMEPETMYPTGEDSLKVLVEELEEQGTETEVTETAVMEQNVESGNAEDAGVDFTGQRVQIYYEDLDTYYPGECVSFNQVSGFAFVLYEGFTEQTQVPVGFIKPLDDEQTQASVPASSVFFDGCRVKALFGTDWCDATLGPQAEDSSWAVYYDAEPETLYPLFEDSLQLAEVQQETEEQAEAIFWTGYAVNVLWENDGETYPGFCVTDDGTTATVTLEAFGDEQYPVPTHCLSERANPI